jgi:ribokinase
VRVAVVGHVEWIEFARVEQVPRPGEIVHALETWEAPAGGGAVAAVQLARHTGECVFLTALGDDELGRRAGRELGELGVRVEAAWRDEPQRRAFVHLDEDGERTITVIGARLGPRGGDSLPWGDLTDCDAVYFTAGDAAAVRAARAAQALVASARAKEVLAEAGVEVDVVVASATDEGERVEPGELEPPPRYLALTSGSGGGELRAADGTTSSWKPVPLPGEVADAYGAGDSFAAGLTFGLGSGLPIDEALAVGARWGADAMTKRGPYG